MHEDGPNGHSYLVSAARAPIAKFGGALSIVPATELGGVANLRRRGTVRAAGRCDDRRGPDGGCAGARVAAASRPCVLGGGGSVAMAFERVEPAGRAA